MKCRIKNCDNPSAYPLEGPSGVLCKEHESDKHHLEYFVSDRRVSVETYIHMKNDGSLA